MKKNLLLMLILLVAAAGVNAQINLLTKGDFEGLATLHQPAEPGGSPIIWTNSNPNAPYVSANFNFSPGDDNWRLKKSNTGYIKSDFYEDAYQGTQALKLLINKNYSQPSWYNNAVYKAFAADKNTKYTVKLWAKGNGKIYPQFFTKSVPIGGQPSKTPATTDTWELMEFTLDVAARTASGANDAVAEADYAGATVFAIGMVTVADYVTVETFTAIDNVEIIDAADTGLNGPDAPATAVYVNDKTVYFDLPEDSKVSVYNSMGSLVKSVGVAVGESLPLKDFNGLHILKIETFNGVDTHKIMLK